MDNDQCALAPDGSLLDESLIQFIYDPDDPRPMPTLGRGQRSKKTSRLQESLLAEKQDDDGNTIAARERRPIATGAATNRNAPNVLNVDESDADDGDFMDPGDDDDDASSFNDSDAEPIEESEIMVTNAELTSMLSAKTLPLTTAGNTQRRVTAAPSKRKATTSLSCPSTNPLPKKPRQTTIEDVEDNEGHAFNTADSMDMLADAPPQPLGKSNSQASISSGVPEPRPLGKSDSQASISSAMDGKKNYVYLFYEPVSTDHDGTVLPGAKYYKCWHGSRRTFKITAGMKYSLKNLISHLQSNFPAMYQLLSSFKSRGSPPTPFEVKIAMASSDISETDINLHLQSLSLGTTSKIGEAFEKQVNASWNQVEFEKRLAEWIIACDQPFDQVDHPAFRELLAYAHMGGSRKPLSIPGKTTIRKRIMKMGDDVIEQIKSMFKELKSKVSISLDAWTSSNQFAFLAIVAHYVSNDGKLEELLIDFKEIIGEHSGENMADLVWSTLTVYGLTDKVVAFVMDNATNNDTLLRGIETRCHAAGIPFSAQDARGRCMPHTIHLSAIALLEESHAISSDDARRASSRVVNYQDIAMETSVVNDDDDGVSLEEEEEEEKASPLTFDVDTSAVGRLRRIVRAIRSSPQRRQEWARAVAFTQPGVKPLNPILDVRTRWSSTYQMLQRAIRFEKAIQHFASSHRDLRDFELTDSDWRNLNQIAEWLTIFVAATTEMSATKSPMISTTHAVFRGLQDQLKNILTSLPDDVTPAVKSGILKAHRKLSDYFYKFDQSPYYTWAAILDPRITYQELKEDYSQDADLSAALEKSKQSLYTHYNMFYTKHTSATSLPVATTTVATTISAPQALSSTPVFDFRARFRHKVPTTTLNELDEYMRLPPQEFHSCDPIQWWYSQRTRFPTLYRLACDILSIPGSAVAVERIFSGGRDTISLRRASLKPNTIRTLMLLKQWIRLQKNRPARS